MKIGIVHKLPGSVDLLQRAVHQRPLASVAWVARTGAEAIEQCVKEKPDLILMDLTMPVMDGVETTRRIMAVAPCPIVIVTESVLTHAARVFEAMGCGAVDAVDLPDPGATDLPEALAPLLAKIGIVSRLIDDRNDRRNGPGLSRVTVPPARAIVAIGASAGGPAAVAALLQGLPRDFAAAVVIVQHVDARFAAGMTEWLSTHSAMPVRVAVDGERAAAGQVLVAGSDEHLVVTGGTRLGYQADPRHSAYRPSIDAFLHSVSRNWYGAAIGVLLTGMGRDGAVGLKALRDAGHYTIAQDEASSAVYGMPKAAVTLDAAVEVLPIERIAARLIETVARETQTKILSAAGGRWIPGSGR